MIQIGGVYTTFCQTKSILLQSIAIEMGGASRYFSEVSGSGFDEILLNINTRNEQHKNDDDLCNNCQSVGAASSSGLMACCKDVESAALSSNILDCYALSWLGRAEDVHRMTDFSGTSLMWRHSPEC